METGLSFIEFNYMILQAYDFMVLNRDHGCRLQMGGNDQWGNILAGTDLIRRVNGGDAEALTFPLLTTASGAKMGKTEKGAIWLDAEKTSPYDYYQFWINTDDRDVEKFLALFTFLPMEDVKRLGSLQGADIREAKEILAFETTSLLHGEEEATKARDAAKALFSGGGQGDADSMPTFEMDGARLEEGIPAFILLADCGIVKSRGEARRLVQQGGAYVNGSRIEAFDQIIGHSNMEDGQILIRAGKKKYIRIVTK
jgi:tyrosyl-tRNA synthetase